MLGRMTGRKGENVDDGRVVVAGPSETEGLGEDGLLNASDGIGDAREDMLPL